MRPWSWCRRAASASPHDGARSVVKTIEEAVDFLLRQQAIARKDVESVGIVVPGSIDQKGERVIDAYNLGFHDVPLKALAQEAFGEIPVYLANDANGAALAELYAGAFRGCKTAVLFTLGTGLGGGIILGGHMFNGGMNQGVELRHMYLVNGGEHCTCGNDGCMEAYCAASALARDGKRAMEQHPRASSPRARAEPGECRCKARHRLRKRRRRSGKGCVRSIYRQPVLRLRLYL